MSDAAASSRAVLTDFLFERFREVPSAEAFVWRDQSYPYASLLDETTRVASRLTAEGVRAGMVVSLESDFSPTATAALLALIRAGAVVVPLAPASAARHQEFRRIASVGKRLVVSATGDVSLRNDPAQRGTTPHELYERLRREGAAGLVLFTSGSTGTPKAAVHDWRRLLQKYRTRRHSYRTLAFLLFDHIGGVDTLLYSLSNVSCLITVSDRSPDVICAAVERHRVEVLPVSPSFVNLLLSSEAHRRYDLSSLRIVTYGAETMPEATLRRLVEALPGVRTLQKYGLTELGTLRSQSQRVDSVLVRVGGEGYETRIVGGMLEVRSSSAMLGYLNAPNPFTHDGWFRTGDVVEEHGGYLRILGRDKETITIGGEKFFPLEVESVVAEMPGVEDVLVQGEPNPLLGQVVVARVRLTTTESVADFRLRMKTHCAGRLQPYQIPQRVILAKGPLANDRFKKVRSSSGPAGEK